MEILRYSYDANSRLASRWSKQKGTTYYTNDAVGNLTKINYPASTDVTLAYDALNRMTSMVDAAGTTTYAYTAGGQLWTEDGPWSSDTVTNTYNNRLRTGLKEGNKLATRSANACAAKTADNLRVMIHFIALGLMLTACNEGDSNVRDSLVGTWTKGDSRVVVTLDSDGSFNSKWIVSTNVTGWWVSKGTWEVRDGILITTITNSSAKNANAAAIGRIEHFKIIKLDYEHLAVDDGERTNVFDRK